MNMLSFYGGPAGKDFTITKIFPNKTAMDADIALGNNSPIYAGDYVLISYGDPNQPEFAENLTVDGDISYNATLWKKEWNNGYSYKEIMSIASNYPKFTAGNIDTSLKFGEAPQLTIDSSSLANPKVGLKMPASLRAGTANTTESVAPTATASIVPVYGGTLGNELSFQAKVPQGVTFTPSVSDAGEISWTNNGNLPNPATKSVKGPKGDNGDPGIVISATQPTAESHPVWINPEGEASPAGGTDISLGITSAAVGQIAKITAVDDSGKPTAWEPVDMPTGGGGSGETWELINKITIPDNAEETNALVINKDLNGNPFELKKALLLVYMPKYTGGSTIPTFAFSSLNGISSGGSAPASYTNFVSPNSAQNRSMWWRVSVANNGIPYHEELAKTNVSGNKRAIGGSGSMALFDEYIIDGTEPAKESITEIGTKGNLIYAGCYFALYGVRK